MSGVEWILILSRNQFVISLLLEEYLPKPESRSCSGRGQQTAAASETQSGGDPRTARQTGDTATRASAPTYTPEHPGEAKQLDNQIRWFIFNIQTG